MKFSSRVIKIYDGVEAEFCRGLIKHYESLIYRGITKPKYDPYYIEKYQFKEKMILEDIKNCLRPFLQVYKEIQWLERDYENYMKDSLLLKYREGDRRWMHAGEPKERELITLSTLVFLNDDYEGGVLRFPDFFDIEPKKGRLVIFPSCYMFPHEVTKVTSGTRYTLATAFGYKTLGPNSGHKRCNYYGDRAKSAKEAKENFLGRVRNI